MRLIPHIYKTLLLNNLFSKRTMVCNHTPKEGTWKSHCYKCASIIVPLDYQMGGRS